MSTRCMTVFRDGWKTTWATIYRHCDGYPEEMGRDLAKFLEREGPRHRGWPGLLAANFVAQVNSDGGDVLELHPEIRFGEVDGIPELMEDTDWEYFYAVECRDQGIELIVHDRRGIVWRGDPKDFKPE